MHEHHRTGGVVTSGHTESSDEMLMVRYKRGDRDAFAELVRRYQVTLYNFCLRYLNHREMAREVTQEAFLRVVKRSGDFKHESRFSTWLFSITRNLCIDELRKAKHRNHRSLDDPGTSGQPLGERIEAGPQRLDGETGAADSELRSGIVRAVESLPDEQKEVFLLRQLGGIPFGEIARITETPENTVKSRMRYALSRLKQELSEYEEYVRALR
jgi:RNA polymerase sigma-70 factor (ECF subfamily)